VRAVNKNGVFRKETGKVARPKSKQELEPYTTMLTVGLRERIKDLAYESGRAVTWSPKLLKSYVRITELLQPFWEKAI